jgi:phosphoserine phosphatase
VFLYPKSVKARLTKTESFEILSIKYKFSTNFRSIELRHGHCTNGEIDSKLQAQMNMNLSSKLKTIFALRPFKRAKEKFLEESIQKFKIVSKNQKFGK